MDFKRVLITVILSMGILYGWQTMFPPPEPVVQKQVESSSTVEVAVSSEQRALTATQPIHVETDTVRAVIDEKTGDLRGLTLLQYDATNDANQPFVLLNDVKENTYIAQADLLDANGKSLLKNINFQAAQREYRLTGENLEVRLHAETPDGLQIDKVYTFTKGSYVVGVRFDVNNTGTQTQKVATAYSVVRDANAPEGQGWFMQSYTGPVVYTPEGEFQKIPFADLDDDFQSGKDTVEYQRKADGGYVGMIQHYFMTTWLMQPKNGENICGKGCQMDVKRIDGNLYRAGVNVAAVDIATGSKQSFNAQLFAGPQTTELLNNVADHLDLAKDYGRVHIFASPLFSLLNWLHGLVGNWGWAIVLLTIIVKVILYPLNNAAYKSMAKMRAVAPKLEAIKKKYGEDRMAMQQAMMKLYKDEKINPLGGCLPMLLQMPIFIGLYWMIFLSVELRQAPWLGWVSDLSRPDPWFILPILMAATMWFQTTLNPPPSDPMQAKMMKMMPLIFSIMFFFFPSALVLYYVVNNLLTITQQWYVNRQFEVQAVQGQILDKK